MPTDPGTSGARRLRVIRTADDLVELDRYYSAVAPFYDAEMAQRDDVDGWLALIEKASARTALDLGCGGGRITRRLAPHVRAVGVDLLTALLPADRRFDFVQGDMRALPFRSSFFDIAIAANDPFAHLLGDDERVQAIDEALRVARRVVIDGLALPAADEREARRMGLERRTELGDGTTRHETWMALGGDRYRTTYRYLRDERVVAQATADVRAWRLAEPALDGREVHLAGGLDGRPHDPESAGFVLVIGRELWA